jgi:hypothetical protein
MHASQATGKDLGFVMICARKEAERVVTSSLHTLIPAQSVSARYGQGLTYAEGSNAERRRSAGASQALLENCVIPHHGTDAARALMTTRTCRKHKNEDA